jgi:2Fe-2S ferredoxin
MPRVTILPDGKTVEVARGTSLLEASEQAGAMHGSACGGVCACSTCHVWIRQGAESLSEAQEDELDILDKAFDVKPSSRLGCQACVGEADVVFEITEESFGTYLDEHPAERRALEEHLAAAATPELRARIEKAIKR